MKTTHAVVKGSVMFGYSAQKTGNTCYQDVVLSVILADTQDVQLLLVFFLTNVQRKESSVVSLLPISVAYHVNLYAVLFLKLLYLTICYVIALYL